MPNYLEQIAADLKTLAPKLNGRDRMTLGVNIGKSFATITRYLDGQVADMLWGEKILEEAQKIINSKTTA